jgi:lysophospholipase L1-like esterase
VHAGQSYGAGMVPRIAGLAVAVLALLSLGGSPPTSAARASYYLALGDSLAAGYQPDPTIGRDEGYVARLHRALAGDRASRHGLVLHNLGCDGATTTTLLSGGGGCDYHADSQLAAAERFLRGHLHLVRLITVDIGANDVNRCAAGGTIDQPCVLTALGTVAGNLGSVVQRLRAAAPGVRIVGMTYYDPYHSAWLRGPAGEATARQSLLLTTLLNRILTGVYTAAGIRVADVAGAFATDDLTTTASLPDGRVVPLAVARVCRWTWMCVPGRAPDIHPTSSGYQVIAGAFLAELTRAGP